MLSPVSQHKARVLKTLKCSKNEFQSWVTKGQRIKIELNSRVDKTANSFNSKHHSRSSSCGAYRNPLRLEIVYDLPGSLAVPGVQLNLLEICFNMRGLARCMQQKFFTYLLPCKDIECIEKLKGTQCPISVMKWKKITNLSGLWISEWEVCRKPWSFWALPG